MSLAVLLTPGAGTDASHASLLELERQLVEHDPAAIVDRYDFPYRRAGRRAPDKAPVLVTAVREGAAALASRAGVEPAQIVLGGRSMGGRMCSMAVAEGLPARALVLICYPLHPPGKPDRLRVEHFPAITVPTLFVSGTRDQFGTPDELTAHTPSIAGPVTHVWIDGADHSLGRKDREVAAAVVSWLSALPKPSPRSSSSSRRRSPGLRSSSSRRAVSG